MKRVYGLLALTALFLVIAGKTWSRGDTCYYWRNASAGEKSCRKSLAKGHVDAISNAQKSGNYEREIRKVIKEIAACYHKGNPKYKAALEEALKEKKLPYGQCLGLLK